MVQFHGCVWGVWNPPWVFVVARKSKLYSISKDGSRLAIQKDMSLLFMTKVTSHDVLSSYIRHLFFIIFAPSQRGTFWMFAELIQDYNWILKILFRILLCCSRKLKKTKNFGAVRGQTYMSKRGCYGNDKWPKTKSWHIKTFKLWTPTDSLTIT